MNIEQFSMFLCFFLVREAWFAYTFCLYVLPLQFAYIVCCYGVTVVMLLFGVMFVG